LYSHSSPSATLLSLLQQVEMGPTYMAKVSYPCIYILSPIWLNQLAVWQTIKPLTRNNWYWNISSSSYVPLIHLTIYKQPFTYQAQILDNKLSTTWEFLQLIWGNVSKDTSLWCFTPLHTLESYVSKSPCLYVSSPQKTIRRDLRLISMQP
jgi:hypothetical protein